MSSADKFILDSWEKITSAVVECDGFPLEIFGEMRGGVKYRVYFQYGLDVMFWNGAEKPDAEGASVRADVHIDSYSIVLGSAETAWSAILPVFKAVWEFSEQHIGRPSKGDLN